MGLLMPALTTAGIIPVPEADKRGRRRYATARKEGPHQFRHYYASGFADGVSIKELAEYLGHRDASFTLRVYTNSQELHLTGENLQVA